MSSQYNQDQHQIVGTNSTTSATTATSTTALNSSTSSGTSSANAGNNASSATATQQAKKKRLIDKVCSSKILEIIPECQTYYEMFLFERKLDLNISKKTLDIQEALKRPVRVKKTLRIFVSNLFYTHQDTGAPSWELRIEGRLTEDSRNQKRKFSSFFKHLIIELDSALYGPNDHLIEWNRTPATIETDGFQIRRNGDSLVRCTILFQLEHQPKYYKIDKRLAKLIGKQTDNKPAIDTRPAILFALWQYIKNKSLQDQNDREYISNDKHLKQIFECKKMKYSEIPEKLNCLLSPPDPILIEHLIVRGIGETQRSIYEIDVEVEESAKDFTMGALMMSNTNIQELQQLDEKICDTLEAIKLTRTNYDLFNSFAKDPHQFTNRWLATQSSDLNKSATNEQQQSQQQNLSTPGDTEEERRADYYYQPWLQEAVCRYFYRKIQERRGDLLFLSIMDQ